MSSDDPVGQLDKIFIDNLGDDWDLLENPEEAILGIPEGTVESFLREIEERNLWPSLYEVARRHSEQWMIDLAEFFPHEEGFVEPLVSFLLMSEGQHARVCFAQDADGWPWGQKNLHLLPRAIERVRQIREEVKGGPNGVVGPTLDRVIKRLAELQ